jgi:hypothetical protein
MQATTAGKISETGCISIVYNELLGLDSESVFSSRTLPSSLRADIIHGVNHPNFIRIKFTINMN